MEDADERTLWLSARISANNQRLCCRRLGVESEGEENDFLKPSDCAAKISPLAAQQSVCVCVRRACFFTAHARIYIRTATEEE